MTAHVVEFEGYGHEAREVVLEHFGVEALEEIERILSKPSPDEQLRDELAWAVWKYAHTGQEGSGVALPAQVRRYVGMIDKAARLLRDALDTLLLNGADDDAAASTVILMLAGGGVDAVPVLERLTAILAVTEKAKRGKSKGGRPKIDAEFWLLMDRVADIFEVETYRRAALTQDPLEHVFSGDFFRMAELVDIAAASAAQRGPKTNCGLGEQLKRLLDLRAKPTPIHAEF